MNIAPESNNIGPVLKLPTAPHLRRPFIDAHLAMILVELFYEGFTPFVLNSDGQAVGDPHFIVALLLRTGEIMFKRKSRTFLSMQFDGRYVKKTEPDLCLEMRDMMRDMMGRLALDSNCPVMTVAASPEYLIQILKQFVG